MKIRGMNVLSENEGTKAIQLARLFNMGLKVSPFFVISEDFFQAVLESNDAKTEMGFLKTKLKSGFQPDTLERMSNLVSNLKIPSVLIDEIYKQYIKLGSDPSTIKSAFDLVKQKREGFVAIRASDPNPYLDTYTNIKGKEELIKGIKLCWTSFFSKRAYEMSQNQSKTEPIALIVQKMVFTEKAGEVEFTEPNVFKIKAFWGQTGFISQINPDIYFVSNKEISSKTIGVQKHVFILDKEKEAFSKKELPPEANESQVLEDHEIIDVARLAGSVYSSLGYLKIEFGVVGKDFFIINIRAVKKPDAAKQANNPQKSVETEESQWDFIDGAPEPAIPNQQQVEPSSAKPTSGATQPSSAEPFGEPSTAEPSPEFTQPSSANFFEEPSSAEPSPEFTQPSSANFFEEPTTAEPSPENTSSAGPFEEPSSAKPSPENTSSAEPFEEPSTAKPSPEFTSSADFFEEPSSAKPTSEFTQPSSAEPFREPSAAKPSPEFTSSAEAFEEPSKPSTEFTDIDDAFKDAQPADSSLKSSSKESTIIAIFEKYKTINPELKQVLDLLKQEILKEL